MSWFRKKNPRLESVPADERRVKTEGVFEKCQECGAALYKRELEESYQVCPHCGHHRRLDARARCDKLRHRPEVSTRKPPDNLEATAAADEPPEGFDLDVQVVS